MFGHLQISFLISVCYTEKQTFQGTKFLGHHYHKLISHKAFQVVLLTNGCSLLHANTQGHQLVAHAPERLLREHGLEVNRYGLDSTSGRPLQTSLPPVLQLPTSRRATPLPRSPLLQPVSTATSTPIRCRLYGCKPAPRLFLGIAFARGCTGRRRGTRAGGGWRRSTMDEQ